MNNFRAYGTQESHPTAWELTHDSQSSNLSASMPVQSSSDFGKFSSLSLQCDPLRQIEISQLIEFPSDNRLLSNEKTSNWNFDDFWTIREFWIRFVPKTEAEQVSWIIGTFRPLFSTWQKFMKKFIKFYEKFFLSSGPELLAHFCHLKKI